MATTPAKTSVDSLGGFDTSLTVPFGSSSQAPARTASGPTFEDYAATNPGATEEQYTDAMARRAAAPVAAEPEGDLLAPYVRRGPAPVVKKADDGLGLSEIGATLGGSAIGSRVPNYVNPDLTAAKVDLTRNAAYEQSLIKPLQSTLDQAHVAHQAAQATLSDAAAARDAAHVAAQAVGLNPADIPIEDLAGDKWNKKVVGSMGPGGDSVTEAARNYNVEKGLPADYKATRSGLAVPRSYQEPAHITNARQAVVDAGVAHKTAQAEAAATQLALEEARAARNAPSIARATAATQGAQATLDELSKAKSFLSKIPGFNTIMGGLSAGELVHAYNEFQAGNTLAGVMAGLSGAGGLVGLIPHPAAKAAGAIMSLPPLAYQGYQAYKDHKTKNPDLGKFEPGQGDY
jgi:hypothetical protein